MLAERLSSPRARAAALAIAFSVVAGGVAVASLPQIAAAVEDASVTAGTSAEGVTPDTASVPFTGSGFTPGNVVYAQVKAPDGHVNWSWGTESHTVADDGTVSGELAAGGAWAVGTYEVTLFESDDVNASFSFTVTDEDDTTPAPTTTTPTATATSTETASPEPTDSTPPTGSVVPTETPAPTESAQPTESVPPTASVPPTGTAQPTETPAPAPSDEPSITIGTPHAWVDSATYTPAEAAASGVGYHLSGFVPGVELQISLTLPNGEQAVFASNDPIIPDERGEYSGHITYAGAWPEGQYEVTVQTVEGQTVPVDLTLPAAGGAQTETDGGATTVEPAASSDAAGDATADADAAATATATAEATTGASTEQRLVAGDPAPIQVARFSFTVSSAASGGDSSGGAGSGNAGSGKPGTGQPGAGKPGSGANDGTLASTGADGVLGAAGLGLLALGAGAAVVGGARFLSRRRNADA